ncbi:type VI secretion system baseplate subunit TssG [Puia dinghuensis]|uniref:Type VI secretion system baseplate subunit TssG n=1 Tax=Puia dinghuensis TaxID=1792502 RepID=A0A8J2UDH3_9BACT|nr:type VI secretion system baseplate subunit TssG [Puia dinghuensis]GGB00712.1 hypothetical protein GCM10011511_24990 [Puia dinghuensis]
MLSPDQLSKALADHALHLKAEALVAHVVAGGYPREAFTIATGRFFERAYANDLTAADWILDKWHNGRVHLQLSRPGFYDLLPEGLFFQPAGSEYNNAMGVTEMAALHRWNRNRETGIRNFFQPFEHAGFYQLLQLEEEERALGLEQGMLHRFFRAFWEIPDAVDDAAAGFFNLLIPHAYRITGCLPLMEQSLQLLLGKETAIQLVQPKPIRIDRQLEKGLGASALGDDTVCGNTFLEEYPVYKYVIGPLAATEVTAYLPGGDRYAVIETFNRFFVPAEADTETELEIDRATLEMQLEPGREPVLGYSSILT